MKWNQKIKGCIFNTKFSIFLNSSPKGVKDQRLHLKDVLSPCLFGMVGNILIGLIEHKLDTWFIIGLQWFFIANSGINEKM